jgi:hypothetical protein
MFRRLLKFALRLGVLAVIVAVIVKLLEDHDTPQPIAKVEPPPRPTPAPAVADPQPERPPPIKATRAVPVDTKPAEKRAETVSWVEPQGTVCPPSHPVKAKLASKVFRKPETRGYDSSKPDRCYESEAAAQRDGFREAQR